MGEDDGFNGKIFITGYATFLTFMLISSTNMVVYDRDIERGQKPIYP